MRYSFLSAMLAISLVAGIGPREIVRRSLVADEAQNEELAQSYAYLERVETRQLDGNGDVKSISSKTHEVMFIEGTPYRRLVARDDKPLSPEEQKEQLESLRKNLELRRNETKAERARRIEEYEKKRDKFQKAIREIPDAFDFRLLGEEIIGSRPAYVIEAIPRPGYRPIDRYSKLFTELKGKIWIDKQDYHWARVEAELVDPVWFGWVLVRIGKGARVKIEQTRVNGELWLPRRLWFVVSLRIGLVKGYHIEQETTYTNYRKLGPGDAIAVNSLQD